MKFDERKTETIAVKEWANDDLPREKMIHKNQAALSDTELLAILINTGTPKESVMDLSKRMLHSVQNDLVILSRLNVKDLMKFSGIGKAKASMIAAALELGRRRRDAEASSRGLISTSRDAFEFLATSLADLPHEEFWIILLNRANKILGKYLISTGGLTGTVADQRIIFKKALECSSCGIILAHNHPSGSLKPSRADIELTRRMRDAGRIMDIPVLDHLIVAESDYYSFADNDML